MYSVTFNSDSWKSSKPEEDIHKFFNLTNLLIQELDDRTVLFDGYIESKVDFPQKIYKREKYIELLRGDRWVQAPLKRELIDNICEWYINPKSNDYIITKLWNKCPPKKGVMNYVMIVFIILKSKLKFGYYRIVGT